MSKPDSNMAADRADVDQRGAGDAQGNQIDLRLAPDEFQAIGTGEEIPLAPDGVAPRVVSGYDPPTGETVAPLEVRQPDDAPADEQAIPMAMPALTYAIPGTGKLPSPWLVRLLEPQNLIVMAGVFALHVLLWPLLLVFFSGMVFLIVALPFVAGALLAHYGNVIDDIGPNELEELPRPLRDLGWHEDLWSPCVHVLAALLICYGPCAGLIALGWSTSSVLPVAVAVLLVAPATWVFPAIVLTLHSGSTVWNLRPDRLIQVIRACGRDYNRTVLAWIVAAGLYLWGLGGSSLGAATAMQGTKFPPILTSLAVLVPVLMVGVFAMHYFAVRVGLLYRIHFPDFPWIMQRHIPTIRKRAAGLPPYRTKRNYLAQQNTSRESRRVRMKE